MDHYADDLAAVTAHLDLHDAIHVGHSTGGGEVVHYLARHGEDRVAKAVLISAVPPLMVQTEANPGGLPKSVFDGLQEQVADQPLRVLPGPAVDPFYGYNRPGVEPSEAIIENWWRQGMMGGAKAHYDGIVAFSQTDFTEDLKKITVPVLVMHGDDDQVVPYADSGPLSAQLVQNGTLKTYPGFPHGMPTTHADDDQRRPAGVPPVLTHPVAVPGRRTPGHVGRGCGVGGFPGCRARGRSGLLRPTSTGEAPHDPPARPVHPRPVAARHVVGARGSSMFRRRRVRRVGTGVARRPRHGAGGARQPREHRRPRHRRRRRALREDHRRPAGTADRSSGTPSAA